MGHTHTYRHTHFTYEYLSQTGVVAVPSTVAAVTVVMFPTPDIADPEMFQLQPSVVTPSFTAVLVFEIFEPIPIHSKHAKLVISPIPPP